MKELNIAAKITVCTYEELNDSEKKMIIEAKKAMKNAYAPYSGFHVGVSVLLANGLIITGNNQENAAYPSGLCAERTALFYSNAQYPDQPVLSIAVVGYMNGRFTPRCITPCGSCRQAMLETEVRFGQKIRLLLYGENEIFIVDCVRDLLPLSFDETQLS